MDKIDRAHLRDTAGFSPPIYRYPSGATLTGVVQRFWIPVWDLPAGTTTTQRVLQYPSTQVVVADTYQRLYGVATGLSEITLAGSGWAVGAMLEPGAGHLVLGRPVSEVTDDWVELEPLLPGLAEQVRSVMARDPHAESSHRAAIEVMARAVERFAPVDEEGRLMTELTAWVEGSDEITQVADICERYAISERSLQRLTRRRVGLSPKWLIQRRRLHRASEELRGSPVTIAEVAVRLGYADQAHFTRDFRRVTGMTPTEFVAQQPG